MNDTFLKAAASYYGQPDARKVELFTDGATVVLALELALKDEDMAGIVERMRAMWADAEALQAQQQAQATQAMASVPSEQRMRDEYNGMDKRTRSEFGSFARYRAWRGAVDPYAVQDTVELPAHVYLSPAEATEQQKAMAVGRDAKGNYAVAPEDLTTAQRRMHGLEPDPYGQPVEPEGVTRVEIREGVSTADELRAGYVERTVAATDRLSGADGKPTSNADDFGGVPG